MVDMVERRCWPTISKLIKRKGGVWWGAPCVPVGPRWTCWGGSTTKSPSPGVAGTEPSGGQPANLTDRRGVCEQRRMTPEPRARAIYRYLLGRCTSGRRARIVAWAAGCIHTGTTMLPASYLLSLPVQSFLPGPGWRETRGARFLMQRNGRQLWCRFPFGDERRACTAGGVAGGCG